MAEFTPGNQFRSAYAANPLLDRRVKEGDLGEKSAHGFLCHAL